MARQEEYARQADACREAANKAKNARNPKEGENQLGMAEQWEALGRQRAVHKQIERVLAEVNEPDNPNSEANPT